MGKKRLVRKQPLWEKIRSYPLDVLLAVNEQRLSIDWDDYVPHTYPGGTVLCLVFMALRKAQAHLLAVQSRSNNLVFRTDYTAYLNVMARAILGAQAETSSMGSVAAGAPITKTLLWLLDLLLVALFTVSLVNALYVYFVPYRNYTLLNGSASMPKPKASSVFKQNISTEAPDSLFGRFKAFFDSSYYDSDSEDTSYVAHNVNKDVWVLRVWDPSRFLLHLLATFSPVTTGALWVFTGQVAMWKLFFYVTSANAVAFFLISRLLRLMTDKQIIFQETFAEYNRKYVIPKTSVLKKNAIIDATRGPYSYPEDVVHNDMKGHIQNDLAFVSHDIHGKRIKSVRADNLVPKHVLPNYVNRGRLSPSRTLMDQPYMGDSGRRGSYRDEAWQYNSSLHPEPLSPQRYTDREVYMSTPHALRGYHGSQALPNSRSHFQPYPQDLFGRDSRRSSRATSPFKSPARQYNLSYTNRTQLSPGRLSHPSSPQRSPSPEKRVWH